MIVWWMPVLVGCINRTPPRNAGVALGRGRSRPTEGSGCEAWVWARVLTRHRVYEKRRQLVSPHSVLAMQLFYRAGLNLLAQRSVREFAEYVSPVGVPPVDGSAR